MNHMIALSAYLLLAASSALATTTAPAPAGTPAGEVGDYRWVIFLFAVAVAALVYFLRSRRSSV